ncbi:hypothetical protein [Polaromonas aquatica]|uniref:Uncharacterized protein n=1 Tax=Polaromonas aquatica TaxID=332657 RepID=A0ABW1TV37_9BURK
MRGLNTRVAYARAVVLAVIDDEKGAEAINDAFFDAEFVGYHDYCAGTFEVPAMIRDVPLLAHGWEYGQEKAAEAKIAKLKDEWTKTEGVEQ